MHEPTYRISAFVLFSCILAMAGGCDQQTKEFVLPPGDPQAGRHAFVSLQCNACHRVDGIGFLELGDDPETDVTLGGKVTRIKTYGDLVTSIINPSHRLARGNDPSSMTKDGGSRMRIYNDTMTVQQLIDLVAFLESTYEVWVPTYTMYPYP